MNKTISYTEVRANLAKIWDEIIENREVMVLSRRGQEDLAILPAEELSSLMETIHLFRTPANAERLLKVIDKAKSGDAKSYSLDQLKSDF